MSTFNSGNYHPNDYIPFSINGLNPLGAGSLFILPHVQEQLSNYFEKNNTDNYSGLSLKHSLEQLFPNANGSKALVNVNSPKQQVRSIQVDGMLICYTLNLKGRRGVFIEDLGWIGKDRFDSKNGLYQVTKGLDGWDIEEGRFTEISTDHLYIYEGVLDENKAANMAGSVLNSTYQSDLGSKFTLSYTEPSMLKKHGWVPALPMMRNRNTDYQNSKGYLTSQIRRRSAKKITDIVAHGNGCIYLNDSLKGLQADSLVHLRVLLINPPFPITKFAARFEKAGLKYKNYGFVSSLGDFGSKVKGLGMNSPLGNFQMNRKYLEKKETTEKQREETIKTIYPLVAAIRNVSIKATFDAGFTFFGGGPVLLCYSALLSYWTKNDRAQNPLMSSNDIRSKATNELISKTEKSVKNAIENHKNKRL